ncbi:MAG: hypothetical protein CRN43_08600, partial [Candidatus Nephrothrix sp. EaCA]
DYMVNESIRAFLKTQLSEPGAGFKDEQEAEKKIAPLFADHADADHLKKEEKNYILQKLEQIKILDPACGSGAFPMGILHKLTQLHEALGTVKSSYELKKDILSRNIYGVDIMPMAVEIARLRAWLSLVLEEDYKPNDRVHNFGVKPLPNLDFKFVCANSLIDMPQNGYVGNMAENNLKQFETLTQQYFNASTGEKTILREEIEKCINRISEIHNKAIQQWQLQIKKEKDFSASAKLKNMQLKQESYERQQRQWQSYKNIFIEKRVDFFNIKYFFPSVKEGFDVVIGNPPYVQMQKNNGFLAEQLKGAGYLTYERTGDVYALFYEFGFKVLKPNAVHVFITSSQWLKANYGKSLRKLFLSKNPIKLIALGPGMFETAVVDTNILIAKNEANKKQLQGSVVVKPEQINNLSSLAFQPMPYVDAENWAILNPLSQSINEKIKAKGKPLRKWEIQINFGIKTGYNEAFIIDEAKRKELIKSDAKSAEIINLVLRGRDIKKYFTEWNGGYLISTFPSLHTDISKYKAVKKYLEEFLPKINQTGETFINKEGKTETTRKKTAHKWFETQDPIGYREEFAKEKIIWKRIGSQLRFSYS